MSTFTHIGHWPETFLCIIFCSYSTLHAWRETLALPWCKLLLLILMLDYFHIHSNLCGKVQKLAGWRKQLL